MIPRERVVADVAAKHGVRISEDDPLLAWLAVHDVVLEHYIEKWSEIVAAAEASAAAGEAEREVKRGEALSRSDARALRAAELAGKEAADGAVKALKAATEAFEASAQGATSTLDKLVRGARFAAVVAVACPLAAVVAIVAWLVAGG